MATINKVIEYVDGVKPNTYSEEAKFQWMCDLDGLVARVVIQREEGVRYAFPDDMHRQLLIPHPFEKVYALYMQAMIAFHNQEIGDYNNLVEVFNGAFDEYKKAYIRENRPASAGPVRNL